MSRFLGRRYMRGCPGWLERFIGFLILGLVLVIVLVFLVTSDIIRPVQHDVSWVHWVKNLMGVPVHPLFVADPANISTSAIEQTALVSKAMIPVYEQGSWAGEPAIEVVNIDKNLPCTVKGGTTESHAKEDLIQRARAVGASWLYAATYLSEDKSRVLFAWIVDTGGADKAYDLWKKSSTQENEILRIGGGGFKDKKALRIGFWSGRFYNEVLGIGVVDLKEIESLARKVAERQLVYGGPGEVVSSIAADHGGASQPAGTQMSQPVQVAKKTGGVAGFNDPGDADIQVPEKIERYTDNLYEKIDGREGQYRSFNFVELRFGQYLDRRRQHTFDVYLYDMAEPANALGIYMTERSNEATVLPLGREGYVTGSSSYFWKGKYYVNVLGPAEGGEQAGKTAQRIAEAIAGTIEDPGTPFAAEALLPAQDRLPHSLDYKATSALGYDFLGKMFMASYKTSGRSYQMFLIQTESNDVAKGLFQKLAEATAKYDKVVSRRQMKGGETFVGDSMGTFTVVFQKGLYLGGVVECEDRALAEDRGTAFRDSLPDS